MSNFRLIYISTELYDSSEENDGDIDDIPLKKTKFESLIAAESDEEDPTPGRKIAVTNLVVSVASEVKYDFNNLTNDKSETERTEIIFAQDDFQECCEKACTYSSEPDLSSDTTDITVMFGSKEMNIAEPNKVNDENVKDAENEFKAFSFDKDGENGEKSKNPANVRNNENTKDFNNGEDDVVVEVSKNPENVKDNDDIKEFGNGDDDNQVAVETHEQYLYRMLRPGEDHENGITAKDINSTTSINDHVAYGSSSCQKSKYISCTKSEEKVFEFASIIRRKERHLKRTIIKIDKRKIGCNVDIVDLTDTSNQVMHLGDRAKKNALRFAEVLLVPEVDIPADSITAIAHIQNDSVTHYS